MLLGGHSHHERGNVHDLLAHSDVSLEDEDTGVVDGVGKLPLGNDGL